MSPQDRMAAAVQKAKDAFAEFEKANADMGYMKGGPTPAAPPWSGSGVGPTPTSMNPSGSHAGPSGPEIVSSSPSVPERKLSPEDPSYSGKPRDQGSNNLVHSSPSFSTSATPPAIDNSPLAEGVKKSFFAPENKPRFLEKSFHNGKLTIDPEISRSPNLVQRARENLRKSHTCACGNVQDVAISVCTNCGTGPAVNGGMSLSAEIVRRLVG